MRVWVDTVRVEKKDGIQGVPIWPVLLPSCQSLLCHICAMWLEEEVKSCAESTYHGTWPLLSAHSVSDAFMLAPDINRVERLGRHHLLRKKKEKAL